MKRAVCAIFLLIGLAKAAPPVNPCTLVPATQLIPILGITKNSGVTTLKLPSKATESKACSYGGQEYAALIILMKFESPADAREYMQSVRDGLDKKFKTVTEKFDAFDGFSFKAGMLAVKNNNLLRVNVSPRIATGTGGINADLTEQVMRLALRAN